MLLKYEDGTITPNGIDDIFGTNYSKVESKLELVLKLVQEYTQRKLKIGEKNKDKSENYLRIFNMYRLDLNDLIKLNLNFRDSLVGNMETLLYLRNGKWEHPPSNPQQSRHRVL